MLGAATSDGKVEELRALVMDQFHEVHATLLDQGARIDAVGHQMAHLERELEIQSDKLAVNDLELADAVVQIRDTFLKVNEGMGEIAGRALKTDAGCEQFYKEFVDRTQAITVEMARLHATDEDLHSLIVKIEQRDGSRNRKVDSLEADVKLMNTKGKLEADNEGKLDAGEAKELYASMSGRVSELEDKTEAMDRKLRKTSARSRWPRGMAGQACGPFGCGDEACGSSDGGDQHCSHCSPHELRITQLEATVKVGAMKPPGFDTAASSSSGCAGHCAHVSQLLENTEQHRRAIESLNLAMAMAS